MRIELSALIAALLSACSSSSPPPTGAHGGPCDGSSVASEVQSYASGVVATSKMHLFQVKLVDATPAPPGEGINTWSVQLLDMNDKPMSGATIGNVRGWMPDHGHGTGNNLPKVTQQPDAEGNAGIGNLDLIMAGVWQITITASDQNMTDQATFSFCVGG